VTGGSPRSRPGRPWWLDLPDEELLDVPIRALGLRLEGTALEGRLARLEAELERAGLLFRPHVWLSTDWFSPDGVPGFAIPFFLAHPRLARLERRHMLEVEGGSADWCMRLMRHETAHALDNAYRLHRRRRWREVFGPFSAPYRETYTPKPTSEDYVLNLDSWYAQSHPAEDFAETFAVWLEPGSGWRQRYRGWPALRKLEYVDALMAEIADARPVVRSKARPGSLRGVGMSLRTYWRRKQAHYADDHSFEYDESLGRVFSADGPRAGRETAARFLERHQPDLREHVAAVTGQHPYVIHQVLKELVRRARHLGLRVASPERETLIEATALVTHLTTRFVSRRHAGEYLR
jgi:hypothetical protein